jgi:hypothetical protein
MVNGEPFCDFYGVFFRSTGGDEISQKYGDFHRVF